MPDADPCQDCHEPVRQNLATCPHCGRPSRFPNVIAASQSTEQQALQARYDQALQAAKQRGCDDQVRAFQQAVAGSKAVINRYLGETERLAYSDDEIYATFYQRIEGGMKVPDGGTWDKLRAAADTVLFGETNKRLIRFGALTLDGLGLPNYGECSLLLKTSMVAHRASVFEENTVIFMRRHGIGASNDYATPGGYRAPWESRGMVAATKVAGAITGATSASDFAALLLRPAPGSADDQFVEVHVWGSLTIRTLEAITVRRWRLQPSEAVLNALAEKLAQFKVGFTKP